MELHTAQAGKDGSKSPLSMGDSEFDRFVRLLESRTGVSVPPERKPFLVAGLRRRMREIGEHDYGRYYDGLVDGVRGAVEWAALVDHLTVHETHFFRHQPSFDMIRSRWLPGFLVGARADSTLHALSVGCSTGEEAWSLAMLLELGLGESDSASRFGITATDVSTPALAMARRAVYPTQRLEEIPDEYRQSCIEAVDGDEFRIAERLRRRVGFARVNLLHVANAPFRALDIVFCQNVLIYFARDRRAELLDGLARLLRAGGLLLIGPGEVTGYSNPNLERVDDRQCLAYVRTDRGSPA